MKTKILFLAAAFVLTVQGVGAQEATAEVDSVMLAGKVVNHHSHRIYRNCYMRFVQEGRTVAETTTDAEGGFSKPRGSPKPTCDRTNPAASWFDVKPKTVGSPPSASIVRGGGIPGIPDGPFVTPPSP